jgi:alkylation response protein AidB-like acyl-CoA dehydrogenase
VGEPLPEGCYAGEQRRGCIGHGGSGGSRHLWADSGLLSCKRGKRKAGCWNAYWIGADARSSARHLPAETARWSTITQIYEGTNQIQRVVMARQLLK